MSTRYVWEKYEKNISKTATTKTQYIYKRSDNLISVQSVGMLLKNTPNQGDNGEFYATSSGATSFAEGTLVSTSTYPFFMSDIPNIEYVSAPLGKYWHVSTTSGNSSCTLQLSNSGTSFSGPESSMTVYTGSVSKGDFIKNVSSNSNTTYPTSSGGSVSDGYWYIYKGSDNVDPSAITYPSSITYGQTITISITKRNPTYSGTISYEYQYSLNGGSSWTTIQSNTTATSVSIKIPTSAPQFKARVRAKDDLGFISKDYVTGTNIVVSAPYTISVSASPSAGGTVSGGGQYVSGSSATVIATPATGYSFVRWEEGGSSVSTSASYTFTVSKSRTLTAIFANTITISVSASPSAGGTVSGGGDFASGTSVTVRATAKTGYVFSHWLEGNTIVSENSSYTFTATSGRQLVAVFVQKYTISISANPSSYGTVSGGGSYGSGASVTVKATANSGYRFRYWTESNLVVSYDSSYTFTVDKNRTLVAHFYVPTPTYRVSIEVTPTGYGTVSGAGYYENGRNVTLKATPGAEYRFVRWMEDDAVVSTENSYTFTMSNYARSFTAVFSKKLLLWVGIEGKARKGTDMWIGIDGKARKAKQAWIGVEGKARKFL